MTALISPCGHFRYRLERELAAGHGSPTVAVIMVNPSTADATKNDATIRKLIGFGDRNGWGKIIVGNLFAYRATDVRELGTVDDPVGPENDAELWRIVSSVDLIVVAWGPLSKQPKALRSRWKHFMHIAGSVPMFSIGSTAKCGHPKHPLMLPYSSEILSWRAPC